MAGTECKSTEVVFKKLINNPESQTLFMRTNMDAKNISVYQSMRLTDPAPKLYAKC